MARTGLYKSEVKKARDAILSQGRHPSVDAVRIELGNTGSKTTIHKYLKELEEDGDFQGRKATISDALHDLVERLAVQLEDEANERITESQKQQAEMIQSHANVVATLEASMATVKAELIRSHEAMAQEKQSHAQTHDLLQKETITRHMLEQQVTDLKERLAENEAHRLSQEEKHRHARDALEHYRESVKEQRDQDQRRHEQQLQQLQAELRQLRQSLVGKQDEVTKLNQEGARLISDLSHAEKRLFDEQNHVRQLTTRLETLQGLAERCRALESLVAEKSELAHDLQAQLQSAAAQSDLLASEVRTLELELAAAKGKQEAQQALVADLREHLLPFATKTEQAPSANPA